MFDVAPSELLLLAMVALVVIGPKDLPRAMRFVGQWVGKARGMARHFRSGFDAMVREAELEEMEKKWKEENDRIMAAHTLPDLADAPPAEAASAPEPAAPASDTNSPVNGDLFSQPPPPPETAPRKSPRSRAKPAPSAETQ
ncbi:MAG: twin-arginine translocase subunit TatB [Sphingomonadaceae bacterium]|nr:twin-arginine translocase subunit TatB [Sphingomonadaceae bacterium]